LLLAAAVWVQGGRVVLVAVLAFGLVFAGFDVREVLHQIDESRAGLIVIAAVLVALHLMVALLAGAALLGSRRSSRLAAA
jgi:Na+/melibiose symporter-like transporter